MQLAQIKNLLQTYESGTGSDVLAEAQGVARALGLPISATDTSDPQKFQEFVKNAYGIMLTNAAMNKDETDHLREMVSKTFASPSMQPGANRKILAETGRRHAAGRQEISGSGAGCENGTASAAVAMVRSMAPAA